MHLEQEFRVLWPPFIFYYQQVQQRHMGEKHGDGIILSNTVSQRYIEPAAVCINTYSLCFDPSFTPEQWWNYAV